MTASELDVTAAPSRHLPLRGTQNVRDTGGYATESGGTTPWRTLLRSDALHNLLDDGREALAAIGVRTVVDLREPIEFEAAPDALDGVGARLVTNPIFAGRIDLTPSGLEEVYELMVDRCGDSLATAVGVLARPDALPALVHCTAGKDRTGVVIALTLSVAGVSDDVIAEDYALTSRYLDIQRLAQARVMQRALGQAVPSAERLVELAACPPSLILTALARIRAAHGGVREFLLAHGLTDTELDTIRAALTETTGVADGPATA